MRTLLAGARYQVKVKEIAVVKTHAFKKSASHVRSTAKLPLIASAVSMTLTGALAEGTDSAHTPSGTEVAGTASGIPAWTLAGNLRALSER
ncbi:hypothetical protein LGM89_23080 [Burkholderia sp. AU31624]|uniref:hypothetical protein n=1 Tax=Burkholderia TaxID=32008 RepID=UPI000D407F52|nr:MULTISPECIES: hypothetical protein [Burkholderia]MCA8256155.1 hypothetical protein [Burkholderia sp. AU31624]PRD87157.1 hypothetical protein C6P88_30065 [Burkholderia contaminans]